MDFNYLETIGALNSRQRASFYKLFAHFLTVSMRGILFFEGIPDSERVDRAKWLNEIAHRITHETFVLEKNQRQRTDSDIWEMIGKNAEKNPATESDIIIAINFSYDYVINNESDFI